jgi:type I restriction enzyme M protein
MHYTEQISRVLFLKFLDEYEKTKSAKAEIEGRDYTYIIKPEFRRDSRAVPKKEDGSPDINAKKTGKDLKEFVDKKLFPYLKDFRQLGTDFNTMQYKIGEIFTFLDNRIESGHTLREILDIIDELSFQSQDDLFELSHIYEDLLQGM